MNTNVTDLRSLTDDLRESLFGKRKSVLVSLAETARVLMDDTFPVGTRRTWADGRTWVKQRDGSWVPEPSALPARRKILALPAGTPQKKPSTGTTAAVVKKATTAAPTAAPGVKATPDNLPDDPFRYFHKTPDAKLIPVSALRTIRARPEGIKNAAVHMAKAFNGEGDKRKPVSLKDNGDGTYTVMDGNSTTAIARQHNWKNIVATVEPADKPAKSSSATQVAASVPGFEEAVKSGKLAKGVTVEEHVKIAEDFLSKHAKNLQSSLERLKKVMPAGAKIQGRVKEVKSALGKLVRKPKYQRVDRLQDGTGMRVIVKDSRGLNEAINTLKKNYKVVEFDDYVTKPQGGEEGLGYRSFHAIIEEDGLQKEIQLRTENQHKHGEWCHDVYKPVTPKQEEGMKKHAQEISKYARDVGDYFAALDSGRKADAPPCPEPVATYFHCL